MSVPSAAQRAVLDNTARIRVVRAAPGSGKTWLVAELIRRELPTYSGNSGSVAALTFTRVGAEEIKKALSLQVDYPHFVGTLDSLLFRYVIRPFFQAVYPGNAAPRLIPADWSPGYWAKRPGGEDWSVQIAGRFYNLFDLHFLGSDTGGEIVGYPGFSGLERVPQAACQQLLNHKRQVWRTLGWLTHSDAAFVANEILHHTALGDTIRSEIVARFKLIIVDELQDTGYYMGRCLQRLLAGPVRGVLVGDPDQAIFEFNGARPDLFDGFATLDGAVELPLADSRRCPPSVSRVAGQLSDSGAPFQADAVKTGRCFLLRYNDMVAEVTLLAIALEASGAPEVSKILVRSNSTLEALTGKKMPSLPNLYSPVLTAMQRAVAQFRQGRQTFALGHARSALERAVFDHEGADEAELASIGLELEDWKEISVDCLLKTNALPSTGTIFEWQAGVATVIDQVLGAVQGVATLGYVAGKLKPQKRTDYDKLAVDVLVGSGTAAARIGRTPVQTVHSVKGETHDRTVVVWPATKASNCPSAMLWGASLKDHEERRVMYVAMTRTQKDLILCVSEACYGRLVASRPAFSDLFEHRTIAEHIAELTGTGGRRQELQPD